MDVFFLYLFFVLNVGIWSQVCGLVLVVRIGYFCFFVFENSVLILKKINLEVFDVFMNVFVEKLVYQKSDCVVLNSIINNCIYICNLMN